MANSKKEKDKKPAISQDEILQILTSPMPEEAPQEKTFLDGQGFESSSKEEMEEEVLKLWLKGERVQYEDEKKQNNPN